LYRRLSETNLTPVLVLTPLLLFLLSLIFIVRVLFRLHRPFRQIKIEKEWIENFSAAPYRPMLALLDAEDFAFLSRQPGFDLALYKKLRRERLRIFRQYMNRLIADFNRLHAWARGLAVNAQGDNSALLGRLVKLKLSFSVAVFRAEANYLLCCLGYRTLGVRTLLLSLEEMTAQASAILALQSAQSIVG
jgi:hypothetical protein